MIQSWTKEDIEKRLESVKTIDNESTAMLKKILYDLKPIQKTESKYIDRKLFFSALKRFNLSYFDSSIIKMIDYISKRLEKLNLDEGEINSQFESFEAVQDRCKTFFKRGEKAEFTFFKKIMLNNAERFKLYRESSLSFSGRTYYFNTNDFYVLINGINSLHEMIVAVHEIKHIENMYKGYNKGAMLYEELPSLLYQLYAIDYLINIKEDYDTSCELLKRHFIKYIKMTLDVKGKSDIVRKLLTDENFYSNFYENYYIYYYEYRLEEIFNFLRYGISDLQIGYIVSFFSSIEIYLNSERKNSENALSGYLFGLYKIKPHMLDNSVDYFESILGVKDNYDKNPCKKLI